MNDKIKKEVESEKYKYDFKYIKQKLITSDAETPYLSGKQLMQSLQATISAD